VVGGLVLTAMFLAAPAGWARAGAPLVQAGCCVIVSRTARDRSYRTVWRLAATVTGIHLVQSTIMAISPPVGLASREASALVDLALACLASAVGIAAIWAGSRPLLGHPVTRTATRVAGLAGLASLALIPPLATDWQLDAYRLSPIGAAFVATSTVAVGAGASLVWRLRAMRRTADALAVVGIAALLVALGAVVLNESAANLWFVPNLVLAVFLTAAVRHRSAPRCGGPIEGSAVLPTPRQSMIVLPIGLGVSYAVARLSGSPTLVAVGLVAGLGLLQLRVNRSFGSGTAAAVLPVHQYDRLVDDLPGAIAQRQLDIDLEPISRLSDLELVAARTEVVWRHPTLGRVREDAVRHAAQRAGLEAALDLHLIVRAAELLPQVLSLVRADEPWLCAPVAAATLRQPGFIDDLLARLERERLDLDGLVLELDTAPMPDVEPVLDRLQVAGVGVMAHESRTPRVKPIRQIEIDFVVVEAAGATPAAELTDVVRRAALMGARTVVRGVADAAALRPLFVAGADFASGPALGSANAIDDVLSVDAHRALG